MTDNKPDGKPHRSTLSKHEGRRFRSDRIFNVNGEWFFHTREGTDVGPYPSRVEAEQEAERLGRIHAQAEEKKAD